MKTKAQLIAILLAAGVPSDGLESKKLADLEALVAENVPGANAGDADADDAGGDSDIGTDPRTGKLILCQIEFSSEPGGREPVFASVNGYNFNAQRGKEIELDEGFVKHLESVSTTDIEAVMNDAGRPTGEVREIPRRRFQVTRL